MRGVLLFIVFISLAFIPLTAQEYYTEEEAVALLSAYEERESEAIAMIEREEEKIMLIMEEIAKVDSIIGAIKIEIESIEE